MTTTNSGKIEDKSGEFIANIIKILMQNGYPEKKVGLPLEKLYESAHNKNVNFNKVLSFLHDEKGIAHEKTSTKIIFFPKKEPERSDSMDELMKFGKQMFGDVPNIDQLNPENIDFAELAEKAKGLISTMSAEQIQEIQKMVGGLSEDQKKDLIQKAKDLGIK